MVAKKSKSTALTSTEENEAAALAELSDFFESVEVSGMEDVGGEDIKLAVKLFNMGGLDSEGNARRKNTFFDNISEKSQEDLRAVFLLTQKTNRWDEYDNDANKTNVLCQSSDRVTGRNAEGVVRNCKGCPDTGWFRDEKDKPYMKCGEVHNVVGIERVTQKPFIIRFKKTSLKPWRAHLMQHHYGVRQNADGTRGHIPLFAYDVTVSLAMDVDTGNFARPVFTRGEVLSRDEMVMMHESAKGYLEMMSEVLSHADKVDEKHGDASDGLGGSSSDDFAEDAE